HGQRSVPSDEGFDTIVYVTLPPGNYVLSAAVEGSSTNFGNQADGGCVFSSSGAATFRPGVISVWGRSSLFFWITNSNQYATGSRAGTVTLSDTRDIGVDCQSLEHDVTFDITLTADSVDAVHEQYH